MWIQRMQELYSAVARVVLKNYTLRCFSLHNFQAKEFLLMKFYVNGIAFEYKEILGVNIFRDGEQRISVKRSFGSGRPNKMELLFSDKECFDKECLYHFVFWNNLWYDVMGILCKTVLKILLKSLTCSSEYFNNFLQFVYREVPFHNFEVERIWLKSFQTGMMRR